MIPFHSNQVPNPLAGTDAQHIGRHFPFEVVLAAVGFECTQLDVWPGLIFAAFEFLHAAGSVDGDPFHINGMAGYDGYHFHHSIRLSPSVSVGISSRNHVSPPKLGEILRSVFLADKFKGAPVLLLHARFSIFEFRCLVVAGNQRFKRGFHYLL
jgi:hypothetical protein